MDRPLSHHADDTADARPARALRGSRDTRVFLPLMLVGALLGCLSLLRNTPVLIWNFTESVPVGLYDVDRASPAKGDIVVIAPAGRSREILDAYDVLPEGRVLLKHLAALQGDTVCRSGALLTINGVAAATALVRTHSGRVLPVWTGCRTLGARDVLVLAPHPLSFDGRYLGPIDAAQIVGVAHPIFTFPLLPEAV